MTRDKTELADETTLRKKEQLAICLAGAVDAPRTNSGFEGYRFLHNALPEISLSDVRLGCTFLGVALHAPLLISPMTGGADVAHEINQRLATAAEEFGLGLSVGSQRGALRGASTPDSFNVRKWAPNTLVCANLGAADVGKRLSVDDCQRAVEMVRADVLTLHLNPIQEAVQPEGNADFSGVLGAIEAVCRCVEVPVMVKETGCGLSSHCAVQLRRVGVSALDVAGSGGTSWPMVEGLRAATVGSAQLGRTFSDWGIPTADCVRAIRKVLPDVPLVASGGVRTGLDIAKSIALGADIAGMALPLLRAAADSYESLSSSIQVTMKEIAIAMFGIGCRSVDALRNSGALVTTSEHAA